MIITMLGFLLAVLEPGAGESAACPAEPDPKNMVADVNRHRDVVRNDLFMGSLM
jgi:hypothetical protein